MRRGRRETGTWQRASVFTHGNSPVHPVLKTHVQRTLRSRAEKKTAVSFTVSCGLGCVTSCQTFDVGAYGVVRFARPRLEPGEKKTLVFPLVTT